MYKPDYHCQVEGTWDDAAAALAIASICSKIESAFDAERLWGSEKAPALSLYGGAAGTLLGLETLRNWQLGELRRSYNGAAATMLASYLRAPDLETGVVSMSYFAGFSGIALVALELMPDADFDKRLAAVVDNLIDREDTFDSLPGVALLAVHRAMRTGGATRWISNYCRAARVLVSRRVEVRNLKFWRQAPTRHYVGAAHGGATMLRLLGLGTPYNDANLMRALEQTLDAFDALALREGDGVNWPYTLEDAEKGGTSVCSGVTALQASSRVSARRLSVTS